MVTSFLKEYARANRGLEVVRKLVDAEKVRLEHVILDADVHGDPVRRQNAITAPEVHRELAVAGKISAADAAQDIKRTCHGDLATQENLARKEVVAERQVVVREVSLRGRKEVNVAQGLEARAARLRATERALKEKVFADVIGRREAVHRIGAKVFDRQGAVLDANFDVV